MKIQTLPTFFISLHIKISAFDKIQNQKTAPKHNISQELMNQNKILKKKKRKNSNQR